MIMPTRFPCRPFLLALLLSLLVVGAQAASIIWVAPAGRDDAAGTQDRPFATLARARDALRQLVARGDSEDIRVRLRAGVYALTEPLELTAADLGDGRRAVIFEAAEGERAMLVGSTRIGGRWARVAGDPTLWVLDLPADLPAFQSLFREGRSLPRAREPDTGFWKVLAVDDERRQLTLDETLPAAWSDLAGVELNTTAWWHFNRQPVARIAGQIVAAKRAIGTDASSFRINPTTAHSRVWLENALIFADTPGEWFNDRAAHRLYYRAAPDEDPNQFAFTLPRLRELIVVQGGPRQLVRNVHFRRLEFAETDWLMPSDGRLGIQAGAYGLDRTRTYTPTAALRFAYAWDFSVERCAFRDLGEGAIALEIGTRAGRIAANDFTRVGSNVIQVGRMPEYTGIKHPMHRDYARSHEWVDRQEQFPGSLAIWQQAMETVPEAPSQITLTDNSIVDCCTIDLGSVGIFVGYANHIAIEHNLLRNLPYTGISVGWRWAPGLTNCHSNLIARNRIEEVMRQVGDGAGIYLVGEQPGTRVVENFVHDSGGNYWSHGVYTDETSDHMEITGNYATGIHDHSIFMNKNGPNQRVHANNGDTGPTLITGDKGNGSVWTDFSPARTPPDLSLYGPRRPLSP